MRISRKHRRTAMRKRLPGQANEGASERILRLSLDEAESHMRRKLRRQVVKFKHWEWGAICSIF
jgi:hypothetical protein